MALMMEQFQFIISSWEENERERKRKGPEEIPPYKFTMNSAATPVVEEGIKDSIGGSCGQNTEIGGQRLLCLKGRIQKDASSKAERYFGLTQISEAQKLEAQPSILKQKPYRGINGN